MGCVVPAAPDYGALETKLEVRQGPEADLLDMDPGIDGVGVAFERADEEVVAERAGEPGKKRNVQRLDAIDAEGVDVLSVVGVGHAAADGGSEPIVLLAERDFVVEIVGGDVGLQDARIGVVGDGSGGNGGLAVVRDRHTSRFGAQQVGLK